MGSLKESYLESDEGRQENLADALGISWNELSQLDYTVTEDISEDGLLYGYLITFDSNCSAEILSRIAGISKSRTVSLSPWVFERSYEDQYALGAITQNIDHRASFLNEIESSVRLQRLQMDDHVTRQLLLRQIFISIIGALEAFLSDTFISKSLSSDYHLQQFVRNHPEFKQKKISVSEIYDVSVKIKERAKTVMVNTIYHKLPTVREMYASTFSIDFPDISNLQKYILIRHDLVHRNGKTTEGRLVNVSDNLIDELRDNALTFVEELTIRLEEAFNDDFPF